jgi:hypothetical protein
MSRKNKPRPELANALPAENTAPPPSPAAHGTPAAAAAEPTLPTTLEQLPEPLWWNIAETTDGKVALIMRGGVFGSDEKFLAWEPAEMIRVAMIMLGKAAEIQGRQRQA